MEYADELPDDQPLSEEEQSYYDSSDADGLQAKQDFLQALLEEMIAAGQLTKPEQSAVLEQLQQKLEAVEAQVAAGLKAGTQEEATDTNMIGARNYGRWEIKYELKQPYIDPDFAVRNPLSAFCTLHGGCC